MKRHKTMAVILAAAMALGGCAGAAGSSSQADPETKQEAESVAASVADEETTEAAQETTEAVQETTAESSQEMQEETTEAAQDDAGEEDALSGNQGEDLGEGSEDEPDEFMELLDTCAAVGPGSSGSSLRTLRAAAELLDWEEERADTLFDEGMKNLVAEWKAAHSEDELANLKESWTAVAAAMEEIAADPAGQKDAVADSGYTLGHESYREDIREMVTDAVTEALEAE